MLSRLAESAYWVARYIERAENTARIIMMHNNLMLDLPSNAIFDWESLLSIMGSRELFYEHHNDANEFKIMHFLLTDKDNPGSIASSLAQARDNARITRVHLPRDAWESVNNLYWYNEKIPSNHLNRGNRYTYLKTVINLCQQFNGILSGTMRHGIAYSFFRIGRYLERADMTTRVIDVSAHDLVAGQMQELKPFEDIQWMNILKSLAAYQMYRQYVNTRVTGSAVLGFLFKDPLLPRSVYRCLTEMHSCVEQISHQQRVLERIDYVADLVQRATLTTLINTELHDFIDEIQLQLGEIHGQISSHFFSLERSPLISQSQIQ